MGKIKTKLPPVDWVETEPGKLVANVQSGISTDKLVEEIVDMPIDVPSLKSKDFTKEVIVKYPENFADDRKQLVLEKVSEMYFDWKVELSADKSEMHIYPDFSTTQEA